MGATGCRGEIKKKEEESKGDDKFARNVVIFGGAAFMTLLNPKLDSVATYTQLSVYRVRTSL